MASYEEVISELLRRSHRVHPERVVPLLAEMSPLLGLRDLAIYLTDLEHRWLIPVPGGGVSPPEQLDIDSSMGGQAFRTELPVDGGEVVCGNQAMRRLWVPLVDGAERLGVLAATVTADETARRRAEDLATIAAAMVVGKQPYGDALVRGRRLRSMSIAAEMRWESLPPLTYSNDLVEISAVLEPAYEVAGDAFDYALNGDMAHMAILDALGHGLEASRIADLAVAAYRNVRRRRSGLSEMFSYLDEAISEAFGPDKFVTGHLALLDTLAGALSIVSAGHPPPLLLRNGTVTELEIVPSLPFGLGDHPSGGLRVSLQPHDAVLFYTDGVTEARSADGQLFGSARLAHLFGQTAAEDPIAETVRRMAHAVLDHQHAHLSDDATLLLVRWKGPSGR